jgi:hypothetical protein
VLRTKYYPHGDLLKAGPKKGSSFTWQSIVVGLQTFKLAHIWRVGSGSRINIWEDQWIANSPTTKVMTHQCEIVYMTVDELINPYTNRWYEELFQGLFIQVGAERTFRIF